MTTPDETPVTYTVDTPADLIKEIVRLRAERDADREAMRDAVEVLSNRMVTEEAFRTATRILTRALEAE